jgi:DNA-damage-inducible protein J
MSQSAVVHARIDQATKTATEKVLAALGMTPTEAIRLFYRQIAIRKAFPLELHVPNKLTASVLAKSDKNQDIETFDTAADLYASWDKWGSARPINLRKISSGHRSEAKILPNWKRLSTSFSLKSRFLRRIAIINSEGIGEATGTAISNRIGFWSTKFSTMKFGSNEPGPTRISFEIKKPSAATPPNPAGAGAKRGGAGKRTRWERSSRAAGLENFAAQNGENDFQNGDA